MKRPVTVDLRLDDKLKGANSDSEKLVNQDWFKLVLYLKVAWALWQTISAAAALFVAAFKLGTRRPPRRLAFDARSLRQARTSS